MFTTYHSASIPNAITSGTPRALHWAYVEQEWLWPWFYVQIGCTEAGESFTRLLMITTVSDLEQMVAEQGQHFWLEQVQLVTPGQVNKQGRWLMEPLIEVSVAQDDRDNSLGHVFKVEGDRCYSLHPSFGKRDLVTTEVVFSSSQHLRTASLTGGD